MECIWREILSIDFLQLLNPIVQFLCSFAWFWSAIMVQFAQNAATRPNWLWKWGLQWELGDFVSTNAHGGFGRLKKRFHLRQQKSNKSLTVPGHVLHCTGLKVGYVEFLHTNFQKCPTWALTADAPKTVFRRGQCAKKSLPLRFFTGFIRIHSSQTARPIARICKNLLCRWCPFEATQTDYLTNFDHLYGSH